MKTIGIIGGFGPETTAEFYLEVVFGCMKKSAVERPHVLISSVPLPLQIERDLIATNTGAERYIPYLVAEAKRLESAGADFLVLPCNSLHVFIDNIRESVKIPVLSILEEAAKYIKKNNYEKIGLISTSATVKNKIYEQLFSEKRIDYIVPDGLEQAQMDKIIQRLVDGEHLNGDREQILKIVKNLKLQNVDAIALACTDLQLLLPHDDDLPIFDTMQVLADASVHEILS